MSVVGIDLGTEFSKVAVAWRKKISIVPNDLTKLLTPTLVGFTEKERYFGDQAVGQWNRNYKNTVSQLKRYLGRQANDVRLQEEIAFWMKNESGALPDGRFGIDVLTSQGQIRLAAEQILAGYLYKLKTFTSKYLDGLKVKDCVISCPAYFNDAQRRALLTAARLAELHVLRILNESTAIALNYGIVRNLPEKETQRVLFVDVGYANTQVAIADFVRGKLTMRYTSANAFTGGRNLDQVLFNYFQQQWFDKHSDDIRTNAKVSLRLQKEIKRIKKILSGSKDAEWCIDSFSQDRDFLLKIDRTTFDNLVAPVLEEIKLPIIEALEATKNDDIKLHSVELVGGVRAIPCLQSTILSTVQSSICGKALSQLSFTLNGDESVARGCALMCAMLSPSFRVREFQVCDINTWPITITYPSEKGSSNDEENNNNSSSTNVDDANNSNSNSKNDNNTNTNSTDNSNSNSNNKNTSASATSISANGTKIIEQLVIRRGNPSPCTAKVTFSKTANFSFELQQPSRFSNNKCTLEIEYPFKTNLEIGRFHIQMLELSDNLLSEPKVKLMLSLNRHGVIDWPQASLIEFVKRPPEPEPEPEPEVKKSKKGKTKTKKGKAKTKDSDTAAAATTDEDADVVTTDSTTVEESKSDDATAEQPATGDATDETVDANMNYAAADVVDDDESKQDTAAMDVDNSENTTEETTADADTDTEAASTAMDVEDKDGSTPATTPKGKKKKEKKKITRNLVVSGTFTNQLSNDAYNKWDTIETSMLNVDRIVVETEEAKNDLETYIYGIRHKIGSEFKDFIKESDAAQFSQQLAEMEDWLYEGGENANKTHFFDKLAQLKTIGDPIGSRWWEAQQRDNRVLQYKKLLSRYMQFADSSDEKYVHIEEDKRNTVRKCVTKADEWVGNKLIMQDRLQVYENPAVRCAEIDQKYREVHSICEPIMNTPKPPPPKPKEEVKEDKKDTKDAEKGKDESTATATDNKDANTNAAVTDDNTTTDAMVTGDDNSNSNGNSNSNNGKAIENENSNSNSNNNTNDNDDVAVVDGLELQ